MKNDIADILFKYTTGEATLEETNDALKEAEAGFNLEPGRNEITPDEMALTTVGDTPGEANGFGLLDTGTGSMEKVHVTNGKLDEAINQVNHDGTTNMLAFVIIGPNRYEVIRPLCIFNFGEDKRIPYIRFDCEESEDLTQTATILGTLIEKVGLRVPTSFVYKKFSIPEPEEGEEIAKPTYGGGMGGVLPFKSDALLSLKAGADAPIGTQQHIDRLAAAALRKGAGSFKRAFEPVLKMIENADSLEQLRELMEDDTAVAELYAAMDVSEVEELLQKVMLYADLEGRVVEDG